MPAGSLGELDGNTLPRVLAPQGLEECGGFRPDPEQGEGVCPLRWGCSFHLR